MSNILDGLFDQKINGIQRMMDLTYHRNEAITSNITNAETPGYRAVDLTFAGELERALSGQDKSPVLKTDPRHLDSVGDSFAHLVEDLSGVTKQDGNNVDIDIQMGKLAQNTERFGLAADMMRKKMSFIRYALRAGSR